MARKRSGGLEKVIKRQSRIQLYSSRLVLVARAPAPRVNLARFIARGPLLQRKMLYYREFLLFRPGKFYPEYSRRTFRCPISPFAEGPRTVNFGYAVKLSKLCARVTLIVPLHPFFGALSAALGSALSGASVTRQLSMFGARLAL
ncbi:hypothetical protein EVAR_59156_1 [Eumeta japonica]|uniref:Uncharacterized protein n=1 Tax=Eumeta variegata TaxID=151549 RepID=A0A4C1YX19_EUMVA|nr:hypothetical protein EVAR_59156_1 [Eumeta japonica]